MEARPEVMNHNTESVPRLYRVVRSGARYERTLELLRYAKELNPAGITKSGVMVGLGEETAELLEVFRDLAAVLRHPDHRAVSAAFAGPFADGAALYAEGVCGSEDRGAEDGLPACGERATGSVELSRA